jgi:hypothetical protein
MRARVGPRYGQRQNVRRERPKLARDPYQEHERSFLSTRNRIAISGLTRAETRWTPSNLDRTKKRMDRAQLAQARRHVRWPGLTGTSLRDAGPGLFPEDRDYITNQFFPKVLREGCVEVEIRFWHFKTGAALWSDAEIIGRSHCEIFPRAGGKFMPACWRAKSCRTKRSLSRARTATSIGHSGP